MAVISVSRMIHASPSAVFDRVAAVDTWADSIGAITKIEVLTDGPIGVGTRFRETRVMFGREVSEEMTLAELERPTASQPGRMVLEARSHGSFYRTVKTFRDAGSGQTEYAMEFNAKPEGLMARVLGAVLMPIMKKSVCKALDGDMDDLKRACETA
ncbi:MAG: SRPBCC family protein [Planctomycetota bacterium]